MREVIEASAIVFRNYVAIGVAGIAAYFLLPQEGQNLAFVASNLVALIAILGSWRRRRLAPSSGWLLLAAFPAATAVGNSIYFVNASILHVKPFPSIGDAAFLGGYLFLAVGLLRLQHARTPRRDLAAVLDAAIITVGFTAASLVYFMDRLLHDPASSLLERFTGLGYPVADVLILAVAARFFLTARRGAVFGWLAGTVLVMLVSDTVFAVLNLLGLYNTGHPVDALILAYNLGWGAVALHPHARDLALPPQATLAPRSTWWRLTALTGASLIAPAVLLIQVSGHHFEDAAVTAAASALLFLLVVGRLAALLREMETLMAHRRSLESALQHRAHHDDLTGLANRRMFVEQLQRALLQRPTGHTAVLFLDLDRFKAINDSLGHGAGDELLVVIARRLRESLDPNDIVARLGGDEFAVLLSEGPPVRSLQSVCAAVIAAVQEPVPLQGLDVLVSASVGTAETAPNDTVETLMHRADTAMYTQKSRVDRRARAAPTQPTGQAWEHQV